MPEEDIHYAESIDSNDDEESNEYDDFDDEESFSPLNFFKRSDALMGIGPVRNFVEWMDNEKTEPDAYLAMLLTLVFFVAVAIAIIGTFVDI